MAEFDSDIGLENLPGMVDSKLEEEGQWYTHAPLGKPPRTSTEISGFRHSLLDKNGNGLRAVEVRSKFTDRFQEAQQDAIMALGEVPRSKRRAAGREADAELIAAHCIKNWDMTDAKGNKIEITPERALLICTDKRYRNHRAFIESAISRLQGDVVDVVEEDEGN